MTIHTPTSIQPSGIDTVATKSYLDYVTKELVKAQDEVVRLEKLRVLLMETLQDVFREY